MALVLLCGPSATHKTHRAAALVQHATDEHKTHALLVEDPSDTLQDDKQRRARVLAAVERALAAGDALVVVDFTNSISGFRYQLYCAARAQSAAYCVVYCKPSAAREEDVELNAFEVPNPDKKWDRPLFALEDEDPMPCDQIMQALDQEVVTSQSLATQTVALKEADYLHDADRVTREVVKAIVKAIKSPLYVHGERIHVPHTENQVVLSRRLTRAELQQYRKQFLTIARSSGKMNISDAFVEFINSSQ